VSDAKPQYVRVNDSMAERACWGRFTKQLWGDRRRFGRLRSRQIEDLTEHVCQSMRSVDRNSFCTGRPATQ
jgi:hypothetical protein